MYSSTFDNMLMVKVHPDCPNEDPIKKPIKPGDVGFDLKAWVDNEEGKMLLDPSSMVNIRTGVYIKLPKNTWGDIRSRSSTFSKRQLFVMGGTIDEGYTGEISVFIWNPTLEPHEVLNGDRLAQLVVVPRIVPPIHIAQRLPTTERGTSGFGSTDR